MPIGQDVEYVVDKILRHRVRGRGYQFLTLMKGAPDHDAEWQPTRDFVDEDGTINDTCLNCIQENKILPQLYDNHVVEDYNAVGGGIVWQFISKLIWKCKNLFILVRTFDAYFIQVVKEFEMLINNTLLLESSEITFCR